MSCNTKLWAYFYANFVPEFIFETQLFYTISNLCQVLYVPIPSLLLWPL